MRAPPELTHMWPGQPPGRPAEEGVAALLHARSARISCVFRVRSSGFSSNFLTFKSKEKLHTDAENMDSVTKANKLAEEMSR